MLTFLFWNIDNEPIGDVITHLALMHGVDILILAESALPPPELLLKLNEQKTAYFYHPKRGCGKIEVFAKFRQEHLKIINEGQRYTIRRLTLPGRQEILVCMAHLPNKRHYSEQDMIHSMTNMSADIKDSESKYSHERTIVVGDLNANPFEAGMVSCSGLHAVMARQTAQKSRRKVEGKTYPFFYNPMWSHFGDGNRLPSGTYHYWNSTPVSYMWNMFDQVLIRPELLDYFDDADLQILTSDGATSLLKADGTPDKSISDHLPILFKLNV